MIYEPGQLIKLIKFSLNFAALQQRLFTVGTRLPLTCYSHLLISTSLSLHLSLGACHMHINSARPTKLFPVCLLRGVCVECVCGVCKKLCLWPTYRNHYAVSRYSGNYALPAAQLPFYANRRRLQLQLQLQQRQSGVGQVHSHFS